VIPRKISVGSDGIGGQNSVQEIGAANYRALSSLGRRFAAQSRPTPQAHSQRAPCVVDAQRDLDDALSRFKQLLETGEIARSEGSPDGSDATSQRDQRPAEPLDANR